ncbi:hypothetical protein HZH66_015462 [Vespula vulgaris]|uniref:Uncharacterized protein n=1 Tax=Vespula vulgaris TaxID=7454 RepID=A0A834MMA6_VESVU|nr:hypothetical protein HZH66_015462 [Vespula vulgaris]
MDTCIADNPRRTHTSSHVSFLNNTKRNNDNNNKFEISRISSNNIHCGRSAKFDNYVLKSQLKSDSRSTLQETGDTFGVIWSTVQRHLHKIKKISRQGICIPHQLSNTNDYQQGGICISLLIRTNQQYPRLNQV